MCGLFDYLFPPKCMICAGIIPNPHADYPFCPVCGAKWEVEMNGFVTRHCGLARAKYSKGNTSDKFGYVSYLVDYVAGDADSTANRFILNLKNYPNKKASRYAAKLLLGLLKPNINDIDPSDTVVVWIPRSGRALKRYGFDHMAAIARALAGFLGIKARKHIRRLRFSREQKVLPADKRLANARSTLFISGAAKVKGKKVVLIDDIITTGASLDTAANMLMDAGAEKIFALTLSKTVRVHE